MVEISNFQVGDIVTFSFTDQERIAWKHYLLNFVSTQLSTGFIGILRYPDKPVMVVTPVETTYLRIAYEDSTRGISVENYLGPG